MGVDPETLAAHAKGVKSLARSLLRDEGLADDVVQDACVAALSQRPDAPTQPWLVRVVRNLSLKRLRTEARQRRRERLAARREAMPPTSEVVERAETHRTLVAAVLALEEPYRSTLLLHHFDGLSVAEIAARLERPPATVRTHLHRGLLRLRKRFGAKGLALLLPLIGLPRTASAATLGVVAMSTTKKSVLFAALVLLALTTVFLVTDPFSGDDAAQRRDAERAFGPDQDKNKPGGGEPGEAEPPQEPDRDLDLHGVVVDPGGKPVASATVATFWDPWQRASVGDPTKRPRLQQGPETVSDRDGRFALRLARGQRVNLRVSAEGFTVTELLYLQAGERARVVLTPGVALVVELVNHEGHPAAGAQLSLSRYAREGRERIERRGVTNADGHCRFEGLPPGTYATINGRHPQFGDVPWRAYVALPASGERLLRLLIPRGRTLRGVVLDKQTGKPIKDALVCGSWIMRFPVRTDAEGRFALHGWGSNRESRVNVVAEGYSRTFMSIALENDIELRLVRGFTVTGRVLGANGQPVTSARVGAWGRPPRGLSFGENRTGPDGRFEIGGLTPEVVHTLAVVADGHGRYLLDFAAKKSRVDLGNVTLPPARRIEGRVLWPDGTPAAGVWVELEGANTDRGRLNPGAPATMLGVTKERRRTDDLGRFRFPNQSPGKYTLNVQPQGGKWVQQPVELGAKNLLGVEVKLAGGHELAVTVVYKDGERVPFVYVEVSMRGDLSSSRMSDANGIARYFSDRPFAFVERVFSIGGRLLPPKRQAIPDGATELSVRLRRAGMARGIVLDLAGVPIPQAQFEVFSDGEPLDCGGAFVGNQGFSGVSGRFEFPVPLHGTASIVLTGVVNSAWTKGRSFAPFTGRLDGVKAGAKNLVLQAEPLPFDRPLVVRVLDPDGAPLKGVQVYAKYMGKLIEGANVLTNEDGRAELRGLAAAKVVVYARVVPRHPRSRDWTDASRVLVPEGQEIELRIKRALWVRGVVLDPEGKPVKETWIVIYHKGNVLSTTWSDEQGHYEFKLKADQAMPLWINARSGKLQARLDDIRPDGTKEFELKLALPASR